MPRRSWPNLENRIIGSRSHSAIRCWERYPGAAGDVECERASDSYFQCRRYRRTRFCQCHGDQAVIGANSNFVASASEAGTTATITTVGTHNFATNETVVIAGVGVGGYNGTFTILSTPTPTTFTYTAPAGLGASSGGTANVGIIILEPPQITKTFGAATIPVNGTTTVNFSINNPNVVAINGSFTDTLPLDCKWPQHLE